MILIVAEHADGKLNKGTLELIASARNSGRLGPVTVLVLGDQVASVSTDAARYADQILVADDPRLHAYTPELWASAVAQIAEEGEANLILISGARSGREYSPRVAVKLNAALIEDATSIKDNEGVLQAVHYTFLSRVTETVEAEGVVVVTIKPGAVDPASLASAPAEQYDVDLDLPSSRVQVTGATSEKSTRIALTEADIVVAGGRGLGTPEDFELLIEGLADHLHAAVGATRAVVDAGWRPYAEQVGQTGKTVQPKVYVAVGISGAVQHLSGMNKSNYIVAINKDAEAPIFAIADYGIVGDIKLIIPALLDELRR